MDGKGCFKAVFSSTRKVDLSVNRMSKKRYFVLFGKWQFHGLCYCIGEHHKFWDGAKTF